MNERLIIQRLVKYEDTHLLFIGTFRSENHAHYVLSLQSLLGTLLKQNLNMLDIIKNTLAGEQNFLLK
ncbi:MAG: hypothetical protein ACRC6X_04845 [Culicoidibacterales bacterium]